MEKIITGVNTKIFYSIIKFLRKNNWKFDLEYDENIFDKGIDFDLYQFRKNEVKIILVWNNWFEGEIKTREKILLVLSKQFNFELVYNEPEFLHKSDFITQMKNLIKYYK